MSDWFGFAVLLIVVLVGVGMYFTGYTMGMQWIVNNLTVVEVEDGKDCDHEQPDHDGK